MMKAEIEKALADEREWFINAVRDALAFHVHPTILEPILQEVSLNMAAEKTTGDWHVSRSHMEEQIRLRDFRTWMFDRVRGHHKPKRSILCPMCLGRGEFDPDEKVDVVRKPELREVGMTNTGEPVFQCTCDCHRKKPEKIARLDGSERPLTAVERKINELIDDRNVRRA
jgi:hypothetical protein